MLRLAPGHRFTQDGDPRVADVLRADLRCVQARCLAVAPDGALLLGGSFAHGEGVAFTQAGRVTILSDLDLFLVIPGSLLRALASVARLRRALAGLTIAPLDLTVIATSLTRAGLQGVGDLPALAGEVRGGAGEIDPSFPLYALHALQGDLLDGATAGPLIQRYAVNRCALSALRAMRALEEPAATSQRAALDWAGGQGLPEHLVALLAEAVAENLDLGLGKGPLLDGGWPRWCAARELLDRLEARQGGVVRLVDRLKGRPRLAWTSLRRGQRPRLARGVHPRLIAIRRDLLHARGADGRIAADPLAGAWAGLASLGLLGGEPADDREDSWRRATAAARLDNPLRLVLAGA